MPGLYRSDNEKRQLESRNVAIQALAVLNYADEWRTGQSRLTPQLILDFQRLAVNQITPAPGTFEMVRLCCKTHDPIAQSINRLIIQRSLH